MSFCLLYKYLCYNLIQQFGVRRRNDSVLLSHSRISFYFAVIIFYAAINHENRFYILLEIVIFDDLQEYGPTYANIPGPTTTIHNVLNLIKSSTLHVSPQTTRL